LPLDTFVTICCHAVSMIGPKPILPHPWSVKAEQRAKNQIPFSTVRSFIPVLIPVFCALICMAADTPEEAFRKRYGIPKPAAAPSAPMQANYTPTTASFRVVTGQLFNIERSVLWKPIAGDCVTVLTNGIVVQEMTIHRTYAPGAVSYNQSIGAYGSAPTRRVVSEERVPGKRFFVANYPASLMPAAGKEIKGSAMLVGTIQIGSDTLEMWDYGTPNIPRASPAAKPLN
jgi:hypothetical protein